MKYKEIFEQIINEINMSPASLRSLAADINAQAGMEFEMIVPGAAESEEGDDYSEADYSQDEGVRSIQDAYDFFYDGDFNGRRDVERLRDQMLEKYTEWLGGKVGEEWETGKEEAIYDWLRYNAAPSDVFGILGAEEASEYPDPTKEDYRKTLYALSLDESLKNINNLLINLNNIRFDKTNTIAAISISKQEIIKKCNNIKFKHV